MKHKFQKNTKGFAMSRKLVRNCTSMLGRLDATKERFQIHQQCRQFLLPQEPASPKVKVLNKAFVPQLVYKYNPIKYYMSKLRMWKLRWTWDREFKERDFVEESKKAAVSLTDILRLRDMNKIDRFSTSNVYYQMVNECINFPHDSCAELLRFRKQDIRQVVPINVHLHNILGLKYAVIDVVMVGLRHVADFGTDAELAKIKAALIEMEPELRMQLEDPSGQLPFVFIELFMRFRRNYSNAQSISGEELANNTNRWLVSVYKICRFNIFTVPPTI